MKKEFTHNDKSEETMHFLHQVDKDDNDQCKQNRLGAGTAFGLPLHSFHFQKIKKIQFLKVSDYMKTITRTKYLDRIIELNGTPDIKIIFIDFMDLAYEKNQGITFLTRLCGRTLLGRQNELYKGVFLKTYKNYIT